MRNIYRTLLLLIAGATQKELARYVRYLKAENQILRGKLPARVGVTLQERRRLVRLASHLRGALDELVSIVHPDTVRRWIRQEKAGPYQPAPRGRRRTPEQICRLILRFARENGWGYTRILGELAKLETPQVARNTVKNILLANGYDLGPQRGPGTWDEFLKIHAATLWQCDFLCKRTLTPKGVRDLFVLVFLHVGTRRVIVAPATYHPNSAWMEEQAAAFIKQARAAKLGTEIVMHDRDGKFTASFDAVLQQSGIQVKKAAVRAPNTMAFVERFIQTIQQECLDYFYSFGRRHVDYLNSQFLEHYHTERPHQAKDNKLLRPPAKGKSRSKAAESQLLSLREVRCRKRLGGLLKHYYRAAA